MDNNDGFREMPRTGRTPGTTDHEHEPQYVHPSVLTDDRENPELLTFEKTWGHRLLAGLGITMLVISILMIAYCIIQIVNVYEIVEVLPMYSLVMYLYVIALIGGVLLIPPACVGIYVAKHPRKAMIAVVMAILALVFIVLFFAYGVATSSDAWVTVLLYSLLLALLPVVYLIAALKVKRSS